MNTFDWNMLYLTCFGIGLALCVVSFLTGTMHLHFGRIHFTHAHSGQHHVPVLNAFTLTGFLCWFGGAGYLLHRYSPFVAGLVLFFAILSGLAGAGLLLWFLTGVLMKHERTLEAADTEIVGMLGRISLPVRDCSVGEMLYTQNGARRSVAVRSADGSAIPRDSEVVVMSYARGIAYVRRWSEFEHGLIGGEEPSGVASDEL